MGTFFKDVPFLHESREGSLEILLVEADFLIRVFFLKLGTDGQYSVTNDRVLLPILTFCFFRVNILSLNLTSERVSHPNGYFDNLCRVIFV